MTTEYSLGKMKYETQKVKPFYHSRMRVDPNDPWKTYPGYFYQLVVQFQEGGKIAYLNESCYENESRHEEIHSSRTGQNSGTVEENSGGRTAARNCRGSERE